MTQFRIDPTEYLMDIAIIPRDETCDDVAGETASATAQPWTTLPDDLLCDLAVDELLEAVKRHRTRMEAAAQELETRRAFLERVWHSHGDDAVPLHGCNGAAFPCHPAGAERLAKTLADQESVATELASLVALQRALLTYLHGGAETMAYFGMKIPAEVSTRAPRGPVADTQPGDGSQVSMLEFRSALVRYAEAIERELGECVDAGDAAWTGELQVELAEVRARLSAVSRRTISGASPGQASRVSA